MWVIWLSTHSDICQDFLHAHQVLVDNAIAGSKEGEDMRNEVLLLRLQGLPVLEVFRKVHLKHCKINKTRALRWGARPWAPGLWAGGAVAAHPSPPPPSRRRPRPSCTSARCRGTGWGRWRSGGGSPAAAAPPPPRPAAPAMAGERLGPGSGGKLRGGSSGETPDTEKGREDGRAPPTERGWAGQRYPLRERGWGGMWWRRARRGAARSVGAERRDQRWGGESGAGAAGASGEQEQGGRGARALCTHRIAVGLLEDLAGGLAGQDTGAAERGGLRGERGRVSAQRRCRAGGGRAGAHRVLLVAQHQALHGRQTLHRRLALLGRQPGLIVAGGERGAGGQHGWNCSGAGAAAAAAERAAGNERARAGALYPPRSWRQNGRWPLTALAAPPNARPRAPIGQSGGRGPASLCGGGGGSKSPARGFGASGARGARESAGAPARSGPARFGCGAEPSPAPERFGCRGKAQKPPLEPRTWPGFGVQIWK